MRCVRLLFSFLSFFTAIALTAQSVRWDPPGGTLPVGQSTGLRLIFEGCAPKQDPAPPKVDGLTMQIFQRGSETSVVNTTITVTQTFTFATALTKNQRVEIPSFTVDTDKGLLRVPAARFDPTSATVGRTGTPLNEAASARVTVTPATVFAGEVFDLAASVTAAPNYYPQFTRGFDWTPDPLITEGWSDPQPGNFAVGGQQHTGFTYAARGLARSPGRFNLNAATHIVNLSVGVNGFGFFQQRQYDQYSITSNTPTLEVKALPAAPAGFSGAVGQFKLTSKVVPEKAAVGEPVTWTLELTGTGNWPDLAGLPARDVSKDFNVVQPKAKRTLAEGKVFDATLTEDVVLVPTKAGAYALGPIEFVFFDPKSGGYQTVRTPRTTVTIGTAAIPQFNLSPPATAEESPANKEPEPAGIPKSAPVVPVAPAGIPRDPLPGSDAVAKPMTGSTLTLLLLTPFALLLGVWFFLALQQARQTDPLRPRREARIRIAATLAKLRDAGDAERRALLLAWQHDSAQLWRVAHAAPPATALPEAAWTALWLEADRALYGSTPQLPADWLARAEAALAAKPVPGFKPLRLFLPRNLFPFAALLTVALLVPCTLLLAAEPHAAYRSGDFPAAEKSWRDTLAKTPTDWIARHNLSLALAQQERAGEAAAHAAAAFVQNPGSSATRWHFAHTAEKSGFAPSALAGFLAPDAAHTLARFASPARWQHALIAAAWLAAGALGWLLVNAYRGRSRGAYFGAPAVFTLAVALAVLGVNGLLVYGLAADERAVVVARAGTLRSIPTEADTAQKTTPLAAGSMALADQTFLGWTRLAFENGQTGWVRKEEVVGLWK